MKNQIKNILLVMMIIGFQNNYVQASEEFMKAIESKDFAKVNSLIASGIDVNVEDETVVSPLMLAIEMQNYDMVDALIKAGADVNNNVPVLYIAISAIEDDVESGKNIIKRLITAHADLNDINIFGETPLSNAIISKNMDIVQILVEAGADIHAEDKDGDTPLDIANRYGTRSIARYLMSKGAIALHY